MRFDEYIGIDWSGAKAPRSSFSISLATCTQGRHSRCDFIKHKLSRSDVFDILCEKLEHDKRVLVGIDCNFGYSSQIVKKQLGDNADAKLLWETVNQLNQSHDNFFAGECWSAAPFNKYFWSSGKQPDWFNLDKLHRETEQASIVKGLGIPESPFKLIGAKQVGKGGLAGMRFLHSLKAHAGNKIAIWPFEEHLLNTAQLVLSEIYPRLFIRHAGLGNKKVRSVTDVNTVLAHFEAKPFHHLREINDHLSDAIISSAGLKWFCEHRNPLERLLSKEAKTTEGWIFGV